MVIDVDTEPKLIAVQETPTSAAARMLELASVTADRLVADAETEAESLVTAAQVVKLRQMESVTRNQLRLHPTEQLSMLDATPPGPPAGFAG